MAELHNVMTLAEAWARFLWWSAVAEESRLARRENMRGCNWCLEVAVNPRVLSELGTTCPRLP